jgi:putative solute:sodium symporter small subunit
VSQAEKQRQCWRRNLNLTYKLLGVWFVATFGVSWYASELNELTFIGPLGFYMSAQGSLLIYLAIIWAYSHYMNKLEDAYNDDEKIK